MKSVYECMSSPIISVSPDTTIKEASNVMSRNDIHCVLVKNSNRYLGIITSSDMDSDVFCQDFDPDSTPVSRMMNAPIITVDSKCSLSVARNMMKEHNTQHLVVKVCDRISGVLSSTDIDSLIWIEMQ